VPVTIKDALQVAGLRTTSSYKPLANYIPREDAVCVARLRAAGAIVLGKTNMPPLAGDYQSDSPIFGRANNPWDLGRTPGGSTGGGAAAVAAGLSPLEIGSDFGGSVRIPAHFCGLFGLRPTTHRVSWAGHIPELPGAPKVLRSMVTIGPLARSVADLRLALTTIAGADGRTWEVPPMPLDAPPPQELRQYRFAWSADFGDLPVTAETRAALEVLGQTLAEQGCRVERANPPNFDFAAALRTFCEIGAAELNAAGTLTTRILLRLAPLIPSGGPIMRSMSRGARFSLRDYTAALTLRDAFAASLDRFLGDWDAWICPVASMPAFAHCRPFTPIPVDGQRVPYMTATSAHVCILSLTGHPIVVLPLARSREGLPIGIQLVGKRWDDMRLLAIAERLAEITGPFQCPDGY
jgi:amidase